MFKNITALAAILALGLTFFSAAGCEQQQEEGPAEKAGKAIDEMVNGKGPAQEAGEKLDQFVKDAGDALKGSGDSSKKKSE